MESGPVAHDEREIRRPTTPAGDTPPDGALVERFVTSRDETAFAALVRRHGPVVLRVCRRVLRHHHDAEDACQATFLVLARRARGLRRRDSLSGWLYKVAYHLAVKHRAADERRRRSERTLPPRADDDLRDWDELRPLLEEELARLPDKYRVPVLLCCLAGRTRDEAAGQLGWTAGTLKMQLERGRQLLRTRLARRANADSR
jgi:RNA polymerase sigma-70 factor (ECF subfamily)